MAKEPLHIQPEEDRYETAGGERKLTSERIIRRMVLEAIYPLAVWAENQDAITKMMVQSTARKKSLYEQGSNWLKILEDFTKKEIEILNLRNPLDLTKTLTTGENEATKRVEELGEAAEDILLACWHQQHGLLMASWPGTEDIPKGIQPRTAIVGPLINKEPTSIWAWDKRNFPPRPE